VRAPCHLFGRAHALPGTTYQAQDGRWLFLAALTPKFQANAFRVLGVGDLFADERIAGLPARILLPENRGRVRRRLADAFRTRPRDEWIALLEQGDCPAGPLGERDEWLDHAQVRANGLCAEVVDPHRGPVLMPGLPLVLTDTPGHIHCPAPTLGQHDGDAIDWPARPHARGAPPTAQRGPLAGYCVLNLGAILAGPYAGALLAELGADVIKVEPLEGDAFRETGFVYNRGQRGLAIDLRSANAREAFYDLVRTADAVVDNSRLGVLERLRVDYASLARVNQTRHRDDVRQRLRRAGAHGAQARLRPGAAGHERHDVPAGRRQRSRPVHHPRQRYRRLDAGGAWGVPGVSSIACEEAVASGCGPR
jgi:crotonobetainyl-CoA:carnitine CoA-transferase CaiB-like acyl-CoA transferase